MPTQSGSTLEMTRQEFELIRDLIHEKTGIFFADSREHLLKSRLSRCMESLGIKSYCDYFYHTKYESSLKEFGRLIDLVTTNETSFYRNDPQLRSFA